MPVREEHYSDTTKIQETIYQRQQYAKGGPGRWQWDFRDTIIINNIPPDAQTILDAGCGEGITLEKICNLFPGKKIIGVDMLDENITICRNLNLPAQKGDITQLKLIDGSVDCCILAEVIEHIEQCESVFRELCRILKVGAPLIVVFPNDAMFKFTRLATLKLREAAYDPGHVRQWTPQSMKNTLSACGYTDIKTRSIPFGLWPICLHGITVAYKHQG